MVGSNGETLQQVVEPEPQAEPVSVPEPVEVVEPEPEPVEEVNLLEELTPSPLRLCSQPHRSRNPSRWPSLNRFPCRRASQPPIEDDPIALQLRTYKPKDFVEPPPPVREPEPEPEPEPQLEAEAQPEV